MSHIFKCDFLDYDLSELSLIHHQLEYKKSIVPYSYNNGKSPVFWEKAKVPDKHTYTHLEHIKKQLGQHNIFIVGCKIPANIEFGMHIDPGVKCSINILLSEDNAPVTFEGIDDVYYRCALLDVSKMHKVKAYHKERLFMRFCFPTETFENIENELKMKEKKYE